MTTQADRPTILVDRRGTRFHENENSDSKDVDVTGLNIAVTGRVERQWSTMKKANPTESKEILSDAHLKLKPGVRYGLIGRNGTGKSTILQALAEKLVPSISHQLRIGSLEQIIVDDSQNSQASDEIRGITGLLGLPAVEYIVRCDSSREKTYRQYNALSKAMEEDSNAQIKAIREIKYTRLQERLIPMRNAANSRTGARGAKARKELVAFEIELAETKSRIGEDIENLDADVLEDELHDVSEGFASLEAQVEALKMEDVEATAVKVLKGLGFSSKRMQQPFNTLSGGWKMRCQLASVLIKLVDLMLLDEATNYLDLAGIVWLERYLQKINETNGTIMVIVSHDRDFINNICEETIVLRDRKLEYFKGNLAAYMEDREAQKLDRIRKKDASERQKAHFEKTIAENIKQGKKTGDDNRLQQAKSRKKRVEERTGMQTSAKGHRFKLTRDAGGLAGGKKRHEIMLIRDDRQILIEIPQAAELRFPGPLIAAEKVSFSYAGNQTPVLEDITLHIRLGDRVGILGLNGSGKTTLIKTLVKDLNPTKGSVTHHPRAKIGWYTQHIVEDLRAQGQSNQNLTALQLLSTVTESMTEGELRGLLSSFGLRGDLASDVPVAKLSGGQLVRLAFSMLVWNHPQILILDEISTHLDFDSVTALKDGLNAFDGAVVLVSHDRYLLRAIVEREDSEDEDSEDQRIQLATGSALYALEKRRLVLLEHGVSQFEQQLVKAIKD